MTTPQKVSVSTVANTYFEWLSSRNKYEFGLVDSSRWLWSFMTWHYQHPTESPRLVSALATVLAFEWDFGGVCWFSVSTLAIAANLDRSHTNRYLHYLIDNGWVEILTVEEAKKHHTLRGIGGKCPKAKFWRVRMPPNAFTTFRPGQKQSVWRMSKDKEVDSAVE